MDVSPLLTDKYMISMCYMYYKLGKHEKTALFEFFFRSNPFKGQYTILAGVNQAIEWIKNMQFSEEDCKEIK